MAKHRRAKDSRPPRTDEEATKKVEALDRRAQELLDEAHSRTAKVDRLSETLRKIRERNHLGELVYNALVGDPNGAYLEGDR